MEAVPFCVIQFECETAVVLFCSKNLDLVKEQHQFRIQQSLILPVGEGEKAPKRRRSCECDLLSSALLYFKLLSLTKMRPESCAIEAGAW